MSRFTAPHRPPTSFRVSSAILPRSTTPTPQESAYPVNLPRDAWIAKCALRLRELLPNADPAGMLDLAEDLWTDVSMFDPTIAAEMEYESRDT